MRRKKILLVDASPTVLMMEKFILRNDLYILITSSNGEAAVRKAVTEQPDLIVADVATCRLLRADEASRHIASIVVLMDGESADGYTDFVTKPINATELLAKVRSALG